jgi:hypothetical protein
MYNLYVLKKSVTFENIGHCDGGLEILMFNVVQYKYRARHCTLLDQGLISSKYGVERNSC